jgi:hypothetical protein
MAIANEAILEGTLQRLFVRDRILYIRNASGALEEIGSVTGRRTVMIQGYKIPVPNDIYAVRGGRVNVRSSLSEDAYYKAFQHKESGQVVLKLFERQGYAYVQIGNNEFGWILLSDLILVSSAEDKTGPVYVKCNVCKQTGHAIQNFNCGLCKGSGHINCLYCQGSKELPCYTCARSGQLTCATCLGMGKLDCGFCIGRGYKLDAFGNKTKCDECNSLGKLPCTECNSQPIKTCYDCNGRGSTTCNQCFGSGFAICYQCFKAGYFSADIQCQKCLGTGWVRTK